VSVFKTIVISFSLVISAQTFAAARVVRSSVTAPAISAGAAMPTSAAPVTATSTQYFSRTGLNSAMLSVDFLGLTKGIANAQAEFFSGEYVASQLSINATSTEEKRKKLNNEKVSVDRTYLGIGATGYLKGVHAEKNLFGTAQLMFGQERDSKFVDNQTGLGLRLGAQIRPLNKFAIDGGVAANNLTGSFVGEAFVRFGILL
jgi:hypothetical protein